MLTNHVTILLAIMKCDTTHRLFAFFWITPAHLSITELLACFRIQVVQEL